MSEYERTPEEIEAEKEARRAELRARIAELYGKVRKLEQYRDQLEGKYEQTDNDVYTPEREYDLTVTTDISHWAGDLEKEGEAHQGDIASGLSKFMSDIMTVIGKINAVIRRLMEQIRGLESELASI